MDRIIQMVIRMVIANVVRMGVRGAMNAGKGAMAKRAGRKSRLVEDPNAPPIGGEPKRKLKPGERKGDEVIYPTDNLTDQMQPRK